MSINNLLAILATTASATNATTIVNTEDTAMNTATNTAVTSSVTLKTGYRLYADEGGSFISESISSLFPPVIFCDGEIRAYIFNNRTNTGDYRVFKTVEEAHEAMGAYSVWREQVSILGQGLVSLSQQVFFTDTTPAHGEFKELIETVLARAEEIIKAPVTSMRGVDIRIVERQKFHVNDYFNTEARPKKALEWFSEIEDLTKKMIQALNFAYVQAWQYLGREERAQLVWRQLDIHFMALAMYFRDYADYSMNELTTGKVARIGLVPTSWDLRENNFEFGFETEDGYWRPYDKAECIEMWIAGTLHPDVLVRCSNAYGFAQLSPHRALPWVYRPYFR